MSSAKYDELIKKLENLEKKFNLLEQSLAQGTHPWGMINARRVIGSFEPEKIIKLKISQSELVNIYCESPQIFANIAIKASLSADSYRQKTAGIIYLEPTGNGNYWIIPTQDSKYWLVPKDNIVINTPVMRTLQSMFNCEGYQERGTKEFILHKPAQVSPNHNEQQWKLDDLGELHFSQNQSKSSFLESEIKQIKEERAKLQSQIQQIEKYISKNNKSPELHPINIKFNELVQEFQKIKKSNQLQLLKKIILFDFGI